MTSKENPRQGLSPRDMDLLDGQILPTARRWLRLGGGLESAAMQTLTHWGEPLVDDRGRRQVWEPLA